MIITWVSEVSDQYQVSEPDLLLFNINTDSNSGPLVLDGRPTFRHIHFGPTCFRPIHFIQSYWVRLGYVSSG